MIYVSYKAVNDVRRDFPQPVPEIDDILAKIRSARIFTTVDMCKGYYAIELEANSRNYTRFVTPNDISDLRLSLLVWSRI
jgi:hypothetical protein